MAFLVVGAVTVQVAPNGWQESEPLTVGELVPAFDGTLRDSRRAYKRRWRVQTRPLDSTEYTNLRNALLGASPLSCTGDALGSATDCAARITDGSVVQIGGGFRRTISFELWEV